MKFKLIPILVLSLLLIPCVANGKEHTHKLDKPIYFYDFENWNTNSTILEGKTFTNWVDMSKDWLSKEMRDGHEFREINTNSNICTINSVTNLNISNYVFSVTDLSVNVVRADNQTINIDLDLEIEDKSLNLYTTNLSHTISTKKDGNPINITQLYYDVIITNITFNVLSEKLKIIENSSQDPDYAFNIANDIKLVKLKDEDFNTLTNLYPEVNFRRANELFEFENPSSYHITNGLSVYVNGEVVGEVTNNNQIVWNDTLLEKYDEYIKIKEISFLPFSSVKDAWKKSENGLVRQSISNFVTNVDINPDFRKSVANYLNEVLPEVSITNECGQAVRVQIGDPKKPLTLFDLENDTTTNIVDQTLLNALFDGKSINYWVINSCTNCPITTNVVDQTFNKYNRDDYVLTLENKPLQEDEGFSYVSITKIPENATVNFNNQLYIPTKGSIIIETTPHTTNGSFVVKQQYYAQTNLILTSGCINSTTNYACPELKLLNWQSCSITNTSQYPCNIKISYSNIINDVAIAIIDEVPIGTNSMTKYKLKSDLIDPVTVIFSWNKNAITNTFTRVEDSENNSINIEVQGMDPVSAILNNLDKKTKMAIYNFCDNVKNVHEGKYNGGNSDNLIDAFIDVDGIFKGHTNFVVVTSIITKAIKDNEKRSKEFLVEDQSQIKPIYLDDIEKAFIEARDIQNKKENKYEK